jgi:hypothetical protein
MFALCPRLPCSPLAWANPQVIPGICLSAWAAKLGGNTRVATTKMLGLFCWGEIPVTN